MGSVPVELVVRDSQKRRKVDYFSFLAKSEFFDRERSRFETLTLIMVRTRTETCLLSSAGLERYPYGEKTKISLPFGVVELVDELQIGIDCWILLHLSVSRQTPPHLRTDRPTVSDADCRQTHLNF